MVFLLVYTSLRILVSTNKENDMIVKEVTFLKDARGREDISVRIHKGRYLAVDCGTSIVDDELLIDRVEAAQLRDLLSHFISTRV